ncbi:NLRC3 [Symbiodinium sp. CCMP2456]|nr:NLRC3 [Symbiodinium sp. CCMP2456]
MSSSSGYGSAPPSQPCQVPESPSSTSAEYGLTDPKSLAEYLEHANIRLVRALASTPRSRGAGPGDACRSEGDAMICSVSHAWESREHPDPCAHQLKCLVDVVSLFDAAYFSDIWLFYDYVSLFQFERELAAEEESFRRSMQDTHVLYAHQCTRTFRIESLTPDDVWEAASKNSEYRVRVYDAASDSVRERMLKELVANRVLYGTRGWGKAEVEWSSARSRSEQNHWIDAPEAQDRNEEGREGEQEPELPGKVPMAPEIFAEEMNSAAFTHRSDAEEVKKLQFKVFLQKVSECVEALFEHLPEGQLGQLAKALPYFKKLKVLRLRAFKVGRAEAEKFAKALACNKTIRELEISRLSFSYKHENGFLWEAIAEALKCNSTLTSINLESSDIGAEGCKAIGEALKTNSTLTSINLAWYFIGEGGAKAICEALKYNSTLTSINLESNDINAEGGKAIGQAFKTNSTLTSINLQATGMGREGGEGAKAIAEALKSNSTLNSIQLAHNRIDDEGGKAIGEALKSNSTLTSINLEGNRIGEAGGKAIGEALKSNSTLTSIQLAYNCIDDEGGKAIGEALKSNSTLTSINLAGNDISEQVLAEMQKSCLLTDSWSAEAASTAPAPEAGMDWTGKVRIEELAERLKVRCNPSKLNLEGSGLLVGIVEQVEAIAEALKTNSTLTSINLAWYFIGEGGAKAICEALKCNSTLTSINLEHNDINAEGGKAIGQALKTNSTLTSINLQVNGLGVEGGKALAEALNSNTTVCEIELARNNIPAECEQALSQATGGRLSFF